MVVIVDVGHDLVDLLVFRYPMLRGVGDLVVGPADEHQDLHNGRKGHESGFFRHGDR